MTRRYALLGSIVLNSLGASVFGARHRATFDVMNTSSHKLDEAEEAPLQKGSESLKQIKNLGVQTANEKLRQAKGMETPTKIGGASLEPTKVMEGPTEKTRALLKTEDEELAKDGHTLEAHVRFTNTLRHCWLPLVVLSTMSFLWLAIISKRAVSATKLQVSFMYSEVLQFHGCLGFTIILLDSYDTSVAIMEDAAFSGLFVGSFQGGLAAGSVLMWIALKILPEFWRSPLVPVLGAGCITAGSLLYATCTYQLESGSANTAGHLRVLLLCSRVISGFGHGFCVQRFLTSITYGLPIARRPEQSLRFVFCCMVGFGLGPIVAASVHWMGGGILVLTSVALVYLAQSAMVMIVVCIYYPRVEESQTMEANKMDEQGAETTRSQPLAVALFLVAYCVRCVIVAGVEVASAFLLEDRYHWRPVPVGISISITFLLYVLLKCFGQSFQKRCSISDDNFLRGLNVTTLIGTLFLFPAPQLWLQHIDEGGEWLLLADALVFPTMSLADGLLFGRVQKYLSPPGSWLDSNNICILMMVLGNGTGRCFAPWFARLTIQTVGQRPYAYSQTITCAAYMLIIEMIALIDKFGKA